MFKKVKEFYEHNRVAIELVGGAVVVLGVTGICGYEIGKKVGIDIGVETGIAGTLWGIGEAMELKPDLTMDDLKNDSEFMDQLIEHLAEKYGEFVKK